MSNLPKDWEADIRQKVNEHEFAYDPAAWGEISTLLDQLPAGSAGAVTKPIVSGSLKLWSIIAISVAIGLTVAIVLWHKQKKPLAPEVESWSIEVSPPETLADTASLNPKIQKRVQPSVFRKRALSTTLSPLAVEFQPVVSSPVRSSVEVLAPLPPSAAAEEVHSVAPPPVVLPEVQLPPPPRRKRNRKTLFPDVIENYKN